MANYCDLLVRLRDWIWAFVANYCETLLKKRIGFCVVLCARAITCSLFYGATLVNGELWRRDTQGVEFKFA